MGTQTNIKYGLAVLAALMFSASSALAQTLTWSGNALWDDTTLQWNNNTVPWSDYAIAQFDTAGSVDLDVNVTASGLVFNGQTILGPGSGPFTLTLAGDIGGSSPIVNVSADTTISAVIAGTDGFTKTGAGTLTLNGENTFTGQLVINQGVVNVLSLPVRDAASSSTGPGGYKNGAKITLDGGTLRYSATGDNWHAMQNGTLTLGANGGTIEYYKGMTFEGAFATVGSGNRTLTLFVNAGIGGLSGPTAFSPTGGVKDGDGGSTSIVKTGGGHLSINQGTWTGLTTIEEGSLGLSVDNALPVSGTLNVSAGAIFNLNKNQALAEVNISGRVTNGIVSTSTLTVGSGVISGTVNDSNTGRAVKITKSGTGTLRLSGNANSYTGGTEINGGTLLVNNTATSGTSLGRGNVTVNTSGTLGGIGYVKLDTTSALTVASGGAIAPGDSAVNSGLGALTLIGTKLDLQNGSSIDFTLGAGNTSSALQFWNYADGNFTFDNVTLNFSGAVDGTYNLFKFFSNSGVMAADVSALDLGEFKFSNNLTDNFIATWDTSVSGVIALNLVAIPEPSTCFLLIVGGTLLLGLRRYQA